MKVEIKKIDKLKRQIKIGVEGEEFLAKRKEVYLELAKNLKVPGFRPGSAPLEVIEKHHDKALGEKFLENVLPFYYRKALEENRISPASMPRIYDVKLDRNSLEFCAEFETRPELDLKESDYKNIKVTDRPIKVEELEIEKVLTNLKESTTKIIQKDLNDEELAKWAGYPNSGKLREAVRGEIFIEKLRARRQNIDSQVGQHLLKNIKVETPNSEVEQAHKELVNRELHSLRLRGVPEKDIDKYKKDIEDKLKNIAEEQIKLSYIIRAIAQKENIKAENNLGEVILGFILSQAKYE